MMTISRINDQYAIASFSESTKKLNILIADKVKHEVNTYLDNGCNALIIDFKNIIFIDSSGFGALVTVFNHARNINAKVLMANLSGETMELIRITKLDQVFSIYNTLAEAEKQII